MKIAKYHSALDSMYPATAAILDVKSYSKTSDNAKGIPLFQIPPGASVYAYIIKGSISFPNGMKLPEGSIFAMSSLHFSTIDMSADAKLWVVTRHGFNVPFTVTQAEEKGRLTYIDGCSDSLLVFPPRKGDGSLSLLYFPKNINQSWHSHPSIRLGFVLSGSGLADWQDYNGKKVSRKLQAGDAFLLPEQSQHRFNTSNSNMRILAYHPDGDWGPEDQNHTMLNRTYLK